MHIGGHHVMPNLDEVSDIHSLSDPILHVKVACSQLTCLKIKDTLVFA